MDTDNPDIWDEYSATEEVHLHVQASVRNKVQVIYVIKDWLSIKF